eukprot:gene5954-6647_t
MPNRCVAGNCSNCSDVKKGIALHAIPFYGSDNPIGKKRRRKWINFVKAVKDALERCKLSASAEYVDAEADNLLPFDATSSDCNDIVDVKLPEDEAMVQNRKLGQKLLKEGGQSCVRKCFHKDKDITDNADDDEDNGFT